MNSMISSFKDVYNSEVNSWTKTLCDDELIPKITFPPKTERDPSVLTPGTPLFCLQQKVNKIMHGIIPFLDLSPPEKAEHLAGFHILKSKPCVFWHEDLPQYVLKTTGHEPSLRRVKLAYFIAKDDIMGRVPMATSLREVVKKYQLDHLYVVQKHLLTLPTKTWRQVNCEQLYPLPEKYKYIVAAEKMDLTTDEETKAYIEKMDREHQKIMLSQLFELFYISGFQNGHYWNFAIAKSGPQQGKLILFDTESVGLVERHQLFLETDPRLRQMELSCGEFAMKEALDEDCGLYFDSAIKQEVYEEFKVKIERDRNNYEREEPFLKALPFIPAVSLVASLVFNRSIPFNYATITLKK